MLIIDLNIVEMFTASGIQDDFDVYIITSIAVETVPTTPKLLKLNDFDYTT